MTYRLKQIATHRRLSSEPARFRHLTSKRPTTRPAVRVLSRALLLLAASSLFATKLQVTDILLSDAVAQSFDIGEAVADSAAISSITNTNTAVEASTTDLTTSTSSLTASSLSQISDDTGLTPQVTEGVSGTRDKKRRNPVLTIQQVYRADGGVKVLADAYVPNSEFADYPMQFDFYVDRRLFSSQFRSSELPGAVGVDIGPDVAIPPFNFTVVAKVVHPNSVYTSVAQGAFLPGQAPQAAATLNCTLEEIESTNTGDSGDLIDSTTSQVFTKTAVKFLTSATVGTYSFSFTADSDSGESVAVSGTVTLADNTTATGSVNVIQSGSSRAVALTGETSLSSDGRPEMIDLSNDDGSLILSCESTTSATQSTAQAATTADTASEETGAPGDFGQEGTADQGLKELEIILG